MVLIKNAQLHDLHEVAHFVIFTHWVYLRDIVIVYENETIGGSTQCLLYYLPNLFMNRLGSRFTEIRY